tara:strand:+ start:552 stop:1688 length:1137 start_codon:yes stop_codon:yes gene_type:complete
MKIREAEFSDFRAIQHVCNRNNVTHSGSLSCIEKSGSDEDEYDRFSRVWKQNPNWSEFRKVPIGWVMENPSGKIVGTLSNVHSVYELNGVKLKAGIASSWAVDPDYRGESLALISKFLFQKDVDLVINATANLEAEKIFRAFRALPVPVANYDEVLFWIIDYPKFVSQFLAIRAGIKVPLIQYPIGLILQCVDRLRSRNILKFSPADIEEVKSGDKRIDQFWGRLRIERDKFLAIRDSKTLHWHFKDSFESGLASILVLPDSKDGIRGYVILKRRDPADQSFSRYQIVDLQVLSNNGDDTLRLLAGAMSHCKIKEVNILEIVGFSEVKREFFHSLAPYKRKFECFPFLYKAQSQELKRTLACNTLWDPCLYDGDASLG